MKNFRRFCVALTLVLALSLSTQAGHMHDGVFCDCNNPPGGGGGDSFSAPASVVLETGVQTAAPQDAVSETVAEVALNIMTNLLTIF